MTRLLSLLVSGALAVTGLSYDPGDPKPDRSGEVFQDGRRAGVTLFNSDIVLSGNGLNGDKGTGYRVKQPCWYEPGAGADEMLRQQNQFRHLVLRDPDPEKQRRYQEFLKQFEDQAGKKGRWYILAYTIDFGGNPCGDAMAPFVFVPEGQTHPQAITIEQLLDIARAALTVPEPTIRLNPDAKNYVNLETFLWLEGVGAPTRSVTATIPGLMSATVTAELDSLEIDAGTEEYADVKTAGCGTTGVAYTEGNRFDCGVVYRKASIGEPRGVYELTVTTVWELEAGGDATPFAFDPVRAEATRDVPVGEVQSTVRRSD
jgi:enoyl reductase